jgi:hypothetical protein
MNVQLFVNGFQVEIKGDEIIAVDYAIASIGNFETRNSYRSANFSVAKTANNRRIFESAEIVQNQTTIPYRRLDCRVFQDGIDMQIRFCDIESIDDNYNLRLYGGNADFFGLIKKDLSELDLSEYDHYHNLTNIINSRTNTEGYIYPIIDFHADSPNAILSNANNNLNAKYLLPSLLVESVIEKIVEDAGYTLQNDILTDDVYTEGIPVISSALGDFRRNTSFERYKQLFQNPLGVVPANINPVPLDAWEVVTPQSNFYPAGFQSLFRFADGINYTASYNFVIENAGAPSSITFYTLDSVQDSISTVLTPIFTATVASGTNTFTGTYTRTIPIPPDNIVISLLHVLNGNALLTWGAGTTIEIIDGEIIEAGIFNTDPTYLFNYITVNSIFGKISQADILKAYCISYCLLCQVNEITKTVTLTSFNQLTENIPTAVNWSDKLDYTDTEKIEFEYDNLAQRNTLQYKEDNSVNKPTGTDGSINIDDQTLEDEKVFYTSPYSASEMVVRLDDLLLPQIKVYTTDTGSPPQTTPTEKGNIRFLLVEKVSGDIDYNYGTGSPTNVTTNLPLAWFIRADKSYNLGFQNALIPNFYQTLQSVLTRSKIVTENIRLTSVDILELDFMKPVYLDKHNAYFYISKIKNYVLGSRESVEVELVKLR